MKLFIVSALFASYASAGNFKSDLNAVGAHAVFPGSPAYSGASEACEYIIMKTSAQKFKLMSSQREIYNSTGRYNLS